MKSKGPTIADVARAAGVSKTAVSFVLNGRDEVAPETAAAVRAVMGELGYVPRAHRNRDRNLAGKRGRASRRTALDGHVALLIPDVNPAASRTFLMERISRALAQSLNEFNLEMVCVANRPAGRCPQWLNNPRLRGVVLRAGELSRAQRKALREVPCVNFFGVAGDELPGDQVVVDDEAIGRMAFEWLRGKGCTTLTVLVPDGRHASFHLRAQAFAFAARLHGARVRIAAVEEGGMVKGILPAAPGPGRRLGIFVAGYNRQNEPAAVEQWLNDAGLGEERGVTVVGAGIGPDTGHAAVYVAPERIGRHCAEQLYWRMQHPDADRRRIMIEPKMLAGKTALPLRPS